MKVFIGKYPGPKSKKTDPTVRVRIDPWDTWSMDSTLTPIILPMLKQLKTSKHGAPSTDDKDVPSNIQSINAKPKEHEHDIDEFHFARWAWVMDEMIFAFETKLRDYYTGDDYLKVYARMQNGFELFGKYFQALWD